jgi:hypothetical protein
MPDGGPSAGSAAPGRRTPIDVVRDHLHAVHTGDPVAMAADYAPDALLDRGETYEGQAAIEAYFVTVPERLAGASVTFSEPIVNDDATVTVPWRLSGGPADGTSGADTFTVADGAITHQIVRLDGTDF